MISDREASFKLIDKIRLTDQPCQMLGTDFRKILRRFYDHLKIFALPRVEKDQSQLILSAVPLCEHVMSTVRRCKKDSWSQCR